MVRNNLFEPADERLVMVSRADSRFYAMDEGNTFNGANFEAFLESKRTLAGDDELSKWTGKFYPTFDATTTTTNVTFRFRGQDNLAQDIDFNARGVDVKQFNPNGTDGAYKVEPRTNGRLMNWRMETNDAESWVLSMVSYDLAEGGNRR